MTPNQAQLGLFDLEIPSPTQDQKSSLYLALLPDDTVKQQISALTGAALKRVQAHGWSVSPERWHSTLFTLRDSGGVPPALVASAQALAGSVHAAAFTIELDRLRLYLPSGAVVLANANKASAAADFNGRLFHAFKAAGLRPKDRCAEHITLMYAKLDALPDLILPKPLSWRVDRFALVLSGLDRYETLGEWPLR